MPRKPLNRWERFWCTTMGWHKRPYVYVGFDGASTHAQCPRCGYVGMIDSQDQLF